MPRIREEASYKKGRLISFKIIFKHRGELNDAYLGAIKDCLWEFIGNIPKSDISIKKINNRS